MHYKLIRINGKQILEHRYIWEQAFGPIPKGYDIHHIDGIKDHNVLENLQLVTRLEHRRLESKSYKKIGGFWWKVCSKCRGVSIPEEGFYKNRKTSLPYCKRCSIKISKKWAEENPEKNARFIRNWRVKNIEKIRVRFREYQRLYRARKRLERVG